MLAVQYSGAVNNPWVYGTTDGNPYDVPQWDSGLLASLKDRVRIMTPATSINEVRSSADGSTYFQDKANNLVYIKLRNGLVQPNEKDWEADSEEALDRSISFVISPR